MKHIHARLNAAGALFRSRTPRLLLGAAMLLLLGSCGDLLGTAATPFTGTWDGIQLQQGVSFETRWRLEQTGRDVTGERIELRGGQEYRIIGYLTGTVRRNTLTFTSTTTGSPDFPNASGSVSVENEWLTGSMIVTRPNAEPLEILLDLQRVSTSPLGDAPLTAAYEATAGPF